MRAKTEGGGLRKVLHKRRRAVSKKRAQEKGYKYKGG